MQAKSICLVLATWKKEAKPMASCLDMSEIVVLKTILVTWAALVWSVLCCSAFVLSCFVWIYVVLNSSLCVCFGLFCAVAGCYELSWIIACLSLGLFLVALRCSGLLWPAMDNSLD